MSEDGTNTARIFQQLKEGALSRPRKPLAQVTDARLNHLSSDETFDLPSMSSINPNDENLMMSTRHNLDDDSHFLPKLRSTAQKYGYYNPPEPQQNIPTSAVNREFRDFDHDGSSQDDDSIEVGRGLPRGVRGTPSKLGGSDILLQLNDSMLNGTPLNRPRPATRKSDGGERGSLRRETTVRRASMMAQTKDGRLSPKKAPGSGRRVSSFADAYAKATALDGSILADQQPEQRTITSKPVHVKNTRFRKISAEVNPGDLTGYGRASSEPPPDNSASGFGTPKRSGVLGTPRSAGNATTDNFALPDVSNLTELLGGTMQSTFRPHSAKAGSRSANAGSRRSASNYIAVDQVPIPDDERQVMNSLQRLQEKVAELEQRKAESEQRMADYEDEIALLQTRLNNQQRLRKTDSGLGTSDEEGSGSGATQWRVERLRLQTTIKTLQTRVDRAESKATNAQESVKRITEERNNVMSQLRLSAQDAHELEKENATLFEENQALQTAVQEQEMEMQRLQTNINDLNAQLDNTQDRHHDDTQRWNLQQAELRNKMAKSDHQLASQNQALRNQVGELQDKLDEQTQELPGAQARLTREKARLEEELKAVKATRLREQREWTAKEQELHAQTGRSVGARGLTVDLTNDVTQLQEELDRVIAQHEEDSQRWRAKEANLREQLERITSHSIPEAATTAKVAKATRSLRNSANNRTQSRSRSKSVPRARATPAAGAQQDPIEIADDESTTDLNLAGFQPRYARRESQKVNQASKSVSVAVENDDDVTRLSTIDDDKLADLRRRLEHERLLKGRGEQTRRSTSAKLPVQSDKSSSSMKPSHRRTVSDSTRPATVRDEDEESIPEHEIPEPSVLSDDGEQPTEPIRRPSVSGQRPNRPSKPFEEMTSAFIMNDITLTGASAHRRRRSSAASLAGGPMAHDAKSCPLCRQDGIIIANPDDIPLPLPLSHRPGHNEDPDATFRPVNTPAAALSLVLHSLQQELAHHHAELRALQRDLRLLNPATGKRAHGRLHSRIADVNEALARKEGQVYDLYDVLEGVCGGRKAGKRVGFEEGATGGSEEWEGFGDEGGL